MKAPSFQFYVRDWLCSTTVQRMPGEEVKAYMYLLSYSWLETPRGSLPNDDDELSIMAKVSIIQWKILKPGVMRNFKLVHGRWVNERLKKVSDLQERNFLNGSKGGNPRLKSRNSTQSDNPPVNQAA